MYNYVVDLPSAAPSDVMAPMFCSGKQIFHIFVYFSFRLVTEKFASVDLPLAAPPDVMAPMLCSGKQIFPIFGFFSLDLSKMNLLWYTCPQLHH